MMSITLEPGFPWKIGIEAARKWMHELGFTVMQKKKGTFVDGYKWDDVRFRMKYLQRMVSLSLLNASNGLTEGAHNAMPSDLENTDESVVEKRWLSSLISQPSKQIMTYPHSGHDLELQ